MASIKEFLENTDTFTATRGKLSITGEAYLERISAQNPKYYELVTKAQDLEVEAKSNAIELQMYLNDDWMQQQLTVPVPVKSTEEGIEDSERFPNEKEISARIKKYQAKIKKLTEQVEEFQNQNFRNKCERLAFVVASWDITANDAPIPLEADAIEREFKELPVLADLVLSTIEKGVFGPLVPQTDSTL